jgi:FkbM family methyltransferase
LKRSAIKRQIIQDLLSDIKLTRYQKERLTTEIRMIRLDHEIAQQFNDYIEENKAEVEVFLSSLDSESKKEMNTIIEELSFMCNHTLMEAVQKYISNREKILKHIDTMESIKNSYKLPLEFHEEGIFKYKHGLKFLPQEVIKRLENTVYLDCGAFCGDSALVFEKEYLPSKIYSFEPITENYQYLLETIKINHLVKVLPIQKGIGEENCMKKLSSSCMSSCVNDEGTEEVELVSIDDFVNQNNLSVGLIKMDLEGYEFEALNGARKTIEKFRPVLLISIYHHPEELFGTKRYIQEMVPDYNFKIKHLADIRPLGEIHLIAW